MKMYIANCSNQNQDFHFRLPEVAGDADERPDLDALPSVGGALGETVGEVLRLLRAVRDIQL